MLLHPHKPTYLEQTQKMLPLNYKHNKPIYKQNSKHSMRNSPLKLKQHQKKQLQTLKPPMKGSQLIQVDLLTPPKHMFKVQSNN
jgi:hypothetical protein